MGIGVLGVGVACCHGNVTTQIAFCVVNGVALIMVKSAPTHVLSQRHNERSSCMILEDNVGLCNLLSQLREPLGTVLGWWVVPVRFYPRLSCELLCLNQCFRYVRSCPDPVFHCT